MKLCHATAAWITQARRRAPRWSAASPPRSTALECEGSSDCGSTSTSGCGSSTEECRLVMASMSATPPAPTKKHMLAHGYELDDRSVCASSRRCMNATP